MPDGYNSQALKEAILALSESENWEAAKLEWKLDHVFESEEADTCLCTHFPIKEICVLKNTRNRNTAEVGNVCVKKFMGIRSDKVFACIKRISKDSTKALNAETIELFREQKLITEWERKFSLDTMQKRSLTQRQLDSRKNINRKILERTKKAKI